MKLYLYSGAGNSFVVLDARKPLEVDIQGLCSRFGTDGLMMLFDDAELDFRMEYYNSDGSGGMMCGNGGRCIVAFADFLGILSANHAFYRFSAPDGVHEGQILSSCGQAKTVKLKMCDVHEFGPSIEGGYFLDTGTRHFVKVVEDVEKVDVALEGKRLRWNEAFAPIGANVNFVQTLDPSTIKVRTFEKGVEAETLACGTGVTASAIASYISGATGKQVRVFTREDELAVSFTPNAETFTDVYLTGPTLLLDVVEELL